MHYSQAIPHLEKATAKESNDTLQFKLADAYYKTGKIECAESLYQSMYDRGMRDAHLYYELGRVMMTGGKYTEASDLFKRYLQTHRNDLVARMLLTSCNSVSSRFRDTTLYVLKPIRQEQFVNAFSIVEYQNGAIFAADKEVFSGRKTSAWTGNSYLDLYTMQKDSAGNWLSPELLQGDINGRLHEGPATFSEDGNVVYFTRSNYLKRKMVVSEDQENNLKIFKATLVNGVWKNLEEFPYNSDDYSVGHPTLSTDGKKIFFVSDMPGGLGGADLYVCEWEGDKWGKPINLGVNINTHGNEVFPYYHSDGALYFSSDAHNSMGGLDVFITYSDGKRWATPENLNYPLNSTKDDFGFSLNKDNTSGFVSSSRASSDKLYAFEKFPPKFNLYGIAHEKGGETRIPDVTVEITNMTTNEIQVIKSDQQGKFKFPLKPESEYHLLCTKMGCFTKTDKISTIGRKYSEDFYADFEVEKIVIDKPIVLENIYYDFDKWNIRPDAAAELDKLAKLLQDNPEIDIEMGSHTDSRGSDQYNMVLSEKRANAAVKYLISKGIESKRLTYKGYGETIHVNQCKNDVPCSEVEHQKNRRTEFKVKKINPKN
jgi:outer membrane protein OmpA-like peptidoglycan-associated protein